MSSKNIIILKVNDDLVSALVHSCIRVMYTTNLRK